MNQLEEQDVPKALAVPFLQFIPPEPVHKRQVKDPAH